MCVCCRVSDANVSVTCYKHTHFAVTMDTISGEISVSEGGGVEAKSQTDRQRVGERREGGGDEVVVGGLG